MLPLSLHFLFFIFYFYFFIYPQQISQPGSTLWPFFLWKHLSLGEFLNNFLFCIIVSQSKEIQEKRSSNLKLAIMLNETRPHWNREPMYQLFPAGGYTMSLVFQLKLLGQHVIHKSPRNLKSRNISTLRQHISAFSLRGKANADKSPQKHSYSFFF